MATTRKIYTLDEVRSILAEMNKAEIEHVEIYENNKLSMGGYGFDYPVEGDNFLFQVTTIID